MVTQPKKKNRIGTVSKKDRTEIEKKDTKRENNRNREKKDRQRENNRKTNREKKDKQRENNRKTNREKTGTYQSIETIWTKIAFHLACIFCHEGRVKWVCRVLAAALLLHNSDRALW